MEQAGIISKQLGIKFKQFGIYLIWLTLGYGTFYSLKLGSKQYDLALVEITLTIVCLVILLTSRLKIPPKEPLILLSLFFIWTLFGVLGARNQLQSLSLVLSIVYSIMTYLIAYNYFVERPEEYFRGLRLFSLVVALQIIYLASSIVFSVNQEISYDGFKSLIKIPLGASNFLAIFLEYGLLMEISLRRRFWGLISIIIVSALTLTFSKAGFLALLVGLTLCSGVNFARREYKTTILWWLVPGVLVTVFVNFTQYGQAYWTAITGITEAHSIYSRLELWQLSLESFQSAPLMGTGLSWSDETHNLFLQLISNTGIVGLIIFVCLILSIYLKLIPAVQQVRKTKGRLDLSSNTKLAFLIAFSIVLLHSTVEPFFFGATTQIWFGFLLAGINVSDYFTGNYGVHND